MIARRRLTAVFLPLVLCVPLASRSQGFDYVTDEEEDLIRDAQGIEVRVPLFLKLLDNRIVALGLRERTAKEREETKKDIAKYEREAKDASKVKDAEVRAKPVNPDVYLRKYTKTELLKGYMQIIDETKDNLDDSYDRKINVRNQVEALEKFLTEQLPRLEKFEGSTGAETAAAKSAIEHSERAIEDCQNALKSLPKTLKPAR